MKILLLSLLFFLIPASGVADNNLLKKHLSPYLQSHASDTVNWQLFNNETFAHARKVQKPLLISSGYSACYWCHRMKTDSFSDKKTGELINAHFIPIIIDREMEIETDQWLQAFMEKQRGFGGWPLTLILTPEAAPVAALNYLPATEFYDTLQRFLVDWQTDNHRIVERAKQHQRELETYRAGNHEQDDAPDAITPAELLESYLSQLSAIADDDYGGFGDAEKFPHIPQLTTLFELHQINPDPALFDFVQTSLAALIGGGLQDHLGGGFFRYTDDRAWSQPHYEKMLYTQSLIAPLLIRVGQTYKQPIYRQAGKNTLLHMIAAFQRQDGYFRASLSAVGASGNGAYYLWTGEQLREVLGEQGQQKIINLLGDEARLVLPFILATGEEKQRIHRELLTAREKRNILVDRKALLGWNGLALSALAQGIKLDDSIRQAGEKLAVLLLKISEQEPIPLLPARPDSPPATFADQVYLARGLADWGQATQDDKFLLAARQLLLRTHKRYYRDGGWVNGGVNPLLGTYTRPVIPDTQLPSPSAIWLDTAWRLGRSRGEPDALETLADQLSRQLPETLKTDSFFHATLLGTLVKRRFHQQTGKTGTQ